MNPLIAFLIDYGQRHRNPTNAALHLIGVPAVFYGLYLLFLHQFSTAFALIFFGYFLQYLGHRAQGNEVGEVTLIKSIYRKLAGKQGNTKEQSAGSGSE
jgi:uncharacterized membrane protein YGL010W